MSPDPDTRPDPDIKPDPVTPDTGSIVEVPDLTDPEIAALRQMLRTGGTGGNAGVRGAQTASGWPYAEPDDPLAEWPSVSQALANKLETALGLSDWRAYTATVTGVTVQSQACAWAKLPGGTIAVAVAITVAAAPTGEVTVSLPAQVVGGVFLLPARLAGASSFEGVAIYNSTATVLVRSVAPSTGIYTPLSASSPMAWAAGNSITFAGIYRGAA